MEASALSEGKRHGSVGTLLLALLAAVIWLSPVQAATISVSTTADELNSDGDCSLREAIQAANTNSAVDSCTPGAGSDTVQVPPGIYFLDPNNAGLAISDPNGLEIAGDDQDCSDPNSASIIDGNNALRILNVTAGNLILEKLTLRHGSNVGSVGGALRYGAPTGSLEIEDCVFTENNSTTGGAIGTADNTSGVAVTIKRSTFDENDAFFDAGSTVSGLGGAIFCRTGNNLTITNSTFSDNRASLDGGAIYAGSNGGTGCSVALQHVTITAANRADNDGNGTGNGGGIFHTGSGSFTLRNSVIANNLDDPNGVVYPDCSGAVTSLGYSLIRDQTGCTITAGPGDLPAGTDPQLAAAALCGGNNTPIVAFTGPTSPLIDAAACMGITEDQRYALRPQGTGPTPCDIGAQEISECGDSIVCNLQGCGLGAPYLEECDDGNTATGDCCNSACQFDDPNTACGDPNQTVVNDCDLQDTCDGAGNCIERLADPNTLCGDPNQTITECDLQNTCDGYGYCLDNFADPNTLCGDPNQTITECDLQNTCDGWGGCLDNFADPNTLCGDPNQAINECNLQNTCESGLCEERLVDDGTACTDTIADCFDAQCDGNGLCDQNHSPESEGTACGSYADTDCTDPDTCNATGTCLSNDEPSGTQCTDTSSGSGGDCNDAQCDGNGTCDQAYTLESEGTPCGDLADTDCTNPDTCDLYGACVSNHEPPGTTCTDEGDQCTLDQCSEAGICAHIFQDSDGDGACDAFESTCLEGSGSDPYVAALPTATGVGCVIVRSPDCPLRNVAVFTEEDLDDDPDFAYGFGLVGFALVGCPNGEATITKEFTNAADLSLLVMRNYGPPYYTAPTAELIEPRIFQVTLTEGQVGDTSDPNTITDIDGPAVATAVPTPALSLVGLAAGLLSLLAAAGVAIRRTRRPDL